MIELYSSVMLVLSCLCVNNPRSRKR